MRPEHRWRPWLAVPLFIVWANVHGLYVIGLGVLGVYVLFTLLGRTPMASRRWEIAGVLLAAFVASSLTPAGPAGLLYPLRYVDAGDWGLRHIAEWQSPNFHDPVQLGLLALIVALLLNGMRATPGLARRHGRVRRDRRPAGDPQRAAGRPARAARPWPRPGRPAAGAGRPGHRACSARGG